LKLIVSLVPLTAIGVPLPAPGSLSKKYSAFENPCPYAKASINSAAINVSALLIKLVHGS
jgi:hypothetical protein